jgi:hypothetical protein
MAGQAGGNNPALYVDERRCARPDVAAGHLRQLSDGKAALLHSWPVGEVYHVDS